MIEIQFNIIASVKFPYKHKATLRFEYICEREGEKSAAEISRRENI